MTPSLKTALIVPFLLVGCLDGATTARDDEPRGSLAGKADHIRGTCTLDDCGGPAADGSGWCDDLCAGFGDCAADAEVCGVDACVDDTGCGAGEQCVIGFGAATNRCEAVEPAFCANGTIEVETYYLDSADGKECSMPRQHCVTSDWGACPLFQPLPPDFCADGTIVQGAPSYITATDGMECKIPSVHCVTNDWGACPQFQPLPPDFCADGTVVPGSPSFTGSADGKECRLPSVHCLTTDLGSCPQF